MKNQAELIVKNRASHFAHNPVFQTIDFFEGSNLNRIGFSRIY